MASLYGRFSCAALWGIAVAVLACCNTPDHTAEFVAAAAEIPAGEKISITFRDGAAARYSVAIDPDSIPTAARRTADEYVQPGGELIYAAREWGEDRDGYRMVKEYQLAAKRTRRSVLVSADGVVLERTHEITEGTSPGPARAAVRDVYPHKIVRVYVIQGAVEDLYRYELLDADGRRFFAISTVAGAIVESGREVDALATISSR